MAHHLAVERRNPVLVLCLDRNLHARETLLDFGLVQHRSVQVDKGKHSAQTRLDFKILPIHGKVIRRRKSAQIFHLNIPVI